MKSSEQIWVIEDDPDSIFVYREILDFRYKTQFFSSMASFQQSLSEVLNSVELERPDLIIADLRLPDGNFLDHLWNNDSQVTFDFPFLVVSSCDDLDILRACFDSGALDYLTKPFTKAELIVKIERLFNQKKQSLRVQGSGDQREELRLVNEEILLRQLTARELQIFYALSRNLGRPVHRKDLSAFVWNNVFVTSKTLDVHLFNLRKKLSKLNYLIQFCPPESYMLLRDRMDPEMSVAPSGTIER